MARPVLADAVYDRIKTMIMDQVIVPDSRIGIDHLVRELGVSSTPIREALARLEADGLVSKESMRGYFANPKITAEEFEDLFDFRLVLEPWVASHAASRIEAAGREALAREIATVPYPIQGDDYAAYRQLEEHDERFHTLLFTLAGNVTAQHAFARTHAHLRTFRVKYAAQLGNRAIVEHKKIYEAVTSGDARAARSAMTTHLKNTRARLIPHLTREASPVGRHH